MRHPGLFAYARAEGLTVVDTNGYDERGAETFDPRISVNHHTAGAPTGMAPSLDYVIRNVLCNALQSRQRDRQGLDVIYAVAAGRANHAGAGEWLGWIGNTYAVGLEVEHVGTTAEPFPEHRVETSVRWHTAVCRYMRARAEVVAQHAEYAANPPGWPGRKQDFVEALLPRNPFRDRIARRLAAGNLPPTIQEEPAMLIPSWAEPINGRWPHFRMADRSATACTITATPGAPFRSGLDKATWATVRYGNAYGLSLISVSGLASAPVGIAETPTGAVVLACADGATFQIADPR